MFIQKWYRAASQVEVKEQCFKTLFNIVEDQFQKNLNFAVLYNDVQKGQ